MKFETRCAIGLILTVVGGVLGHFTLNDTPFGSTVGVAAGVLLALAPTSPGVWAVIFGAIGGAMVGNFYFAEHWKAALVGAVIGLVLRFCPEAIELLED